MSFLPHFLLTSRGPGHPFLYLITNLQIAINCCIVAARAVDDEEILNVYTEPFILWGFFSIDACIRQCMYL